MFKAFILILWAIPLAFVLWVLVRPSWRKTAVALIALWMVALVGGFTPSGWIHLLPVLAVAMFLRGRRKTVPDVAPESQGQPPIGAGRVEMVSTCSACQAEIVGTPRFCGTCGSELVYSDEPGGTDEEQSAEHAVDQPPPDEKVPVQPAPPAGPSEAAGPTFTELQHGVLAILNQQLGGQNLQFDADGTVSFRTGSTAVLVRVMADPLRVLIFSPLLLTVPAAPGLLEAINDLNRRVAFPGRVFWEDATLVVASEVLVDPFVPAHLLHLCTVVSQTADSLDDGLQARFGGVIVDDLHRGQAEAP